MPPSRTSDLKVVITNNETGEKHDLAVSDRGHITWFKRDKSGNLILEERKADERTTMTLEINDTAKNVNLTKTTVTDPKKKIIKTSTENIINEHISIYSFSLLTCLLACILLITYY